VRKVNFGLKFVFGARAGRLRAGGRSVGGGAELGAHLFGFKVFKRAGMRLLFGDTYFRQHVKNGFALDFQFPGQIVNSNLAHPPFPFSALSR
jgi:hypothetical protein